MFGETAIGRVVSMARLTAAVLVAARDARFVHAKANELDALGLPYLIVCGESVDHPNVIHRPPQGKFDALNFGLSRMAGVADVIVMNDVDSEIHGIDHALEAFQDPSVGLVFGRIVVEAGPQKQFYRLLDPIRTLLPVAASGDLLLIRSAVLDRVTPIPSCKAEDTYLMFRVRELGHKVVFSESCWVTTSKTDSAAEEVQYKRRTVAGIYQALSLTRPGLFISLFYGALPFVAPLLSVGGPTGRAWSKGIWEGLGDFLRGDRSGKFEALGANAR